MSQNTDNLSNIEQLRQTVTRLLSDYVVRSVVEHNELTLEVSSGFLLPLMHGLRDEEELHFEQLIDLCGVDYATYGVAEWETEQASSAGFSRAVAESQADPENVWQQQRFAVVYHLLSIAKNWRIRVRVFVDENTMMTPSVIDVYASANWYEREAFDLFGICFEGHDDLRRILTDYSFVGHPFRKDFPLIGHLEMRYDALTKRCVYEPVSIEPRVLVPRVIRHDSRYQKEAK